jgi:hypothetical protein
VTVPTTAGIRIPYEGVHPNDHGIIVRIDGDTQKLGTVSSVQQVGSFSGLFVQIAGTTLHTAIAGQYRRLRGVWNGMHVFRHTANGAYLFKGKEGYWQVATILDDNVEPLLLYDPATQSWSERNGNDVNQAQGLTVLQSEVPDEQVLVNFGNPVASAVTYINLTITPQMSLSGYETIEMGLRGFTSPGFGESADLTGPSSNKFLASWVTSCSEVPKLVLMLRGNESIQANQELVLSIPVLLGIALPAQGVRASDHGISIASQSIDGPVQSQAVVKVQSVGSLVGPAELSFYPWRLNKNVNFSLVFTPTMSISSGEQATLNLPNFRFPVDGALDLGVAQLSVFTAVWSSQSQQLVLTLNRSIAAGEFVEILIPDSTGFRLPEEGIRQNQDDLFISINATDGNLAPQALLVTTPVGSMTDTDLRFLPKTAGQPSAIGFDFTLGMSLSYGDTISLKLPGFWSDTNNVTSIFGSSSPSYALAVASWSLTLQTLEFTVGGPLRPGDLVSMEIPASAGIYLPEAGVTRNDPRIMVSASAVDGSISLTPIVSTEPVGAFFNTSLAYAPPVAGFVTELTIHFVPMQRLLPLEYATVTLSLPGFSSDMETFAVVSSPPGAFIGASFGSDEKLKLFIADEVQKGTVVDVVVAKSAGLRTPVNGITANQATLTIMSDSVDCPVHPAVPIQNSPGVLQESSFTMSSLDFEPRLALATAKITLRWSVALSNVYAGDKLILTLPAFTGQDFSDLAMLGSVVSTATWSSSDTELTITLDEDVSPGEVVEIVVPVDASISVPAGGIAQDQQTLTLELLADAGPVRRVPVMNSPSIECEYQCHPHFSPYSSLVLTA